MLGTSDPWLMSRSSHQPIDPATQHIILKIVGLSDFFIAYLSLFGHIAYPIR